MKKKYFILVSIIILFSSLIFANSENNSYKQFNLNPTLDFSLLGGGITLFAVDSIIADVNQEKFSETKIFDKNNVNGFDRFLMNDYSKKMHYVSTAFEALTVLTPLTLIPAGKEEWFTIGTMYAETMLWAYGFKELGKALVTRARPYMYFDNYPEDKVKEGDWDDSFFSGHTTMSFAAATFTTYAFCKYFPNSSWKIPIIVFSYSLATATSALRIMGGNHFATDVIVGAVIGSATGFLVPFLHTIDYTKSKNKKVAANVMPTGFIFRIALN